MELKDILLVSSDPKLNLTSEAPSRGEVPLVEGKENTTAGVDFFKPKLYEGIAPPSFCCCRPLDENDGMMVGVGGSEDTPEDVETGNVNPVLLSEENVQF
jgi:hypothetical protein